MSKTVDPVAAYLKSIQAPSHVIKSGLDGLIRNWSRAVGRLAGQTEVDRDDYLNDLDGRQLIADVSKVASAEQLTELSDKLDLADEAFAELTRKVATCVWGAKAEKENRWSARKNPWYYSVPKEGKLI